MFSESHRWEGPIIYSRKNSFNLKIWQHQQDSPHLHWSDSGGCLLQSRDISGVQEGPPSLSFPPARVVCSGLKNVLYSPDWKLLESPSQNPMKTLIIITHWEGFPTVFNWGAEVVSCVLSHFLSAWVAQSAQAPPAHTKGWQFYCHQQVPLCPSVSSLEGAIGLVTILWKSRWNTFSVK